MYEKLEINGKPLYIFDDHATAIIPWYEIYKESGLPLNLLTLDHHSDTETAFGRHIYSELGLYNIKTDEEIEEIRESLFQGIDINDIGSVKSAREKLNNDEHIDLSVRLGIINLAFIIQQDHFTDDLIVSDNFPESRMIVLPSVCAIDCKEETHNKECEIKHSNQAIESVYLDDKLTYAQEVFREHGGKDLFSYPYILDIDLDYFRTMRSVEPADISTFRALVTRCEGITIAKEPEYVEECRLEDKVNSEHLLGRILHHIRNI